MATDGHGTVAGDGTAKWANAQLEEAEENEEVEYTTLVKEMVNKYF